MEWSYLVQIIQLLLFFLLSHIAKCFFFLYTTEISFICGFQVPDGLTETDNTGHFGNKLWLLDVPKQDGQFVIVFRKGLNIFLVLNIIFVIIGIQKSHQVVIEQQCVFIIPMVIPILVENKIVIIVNRFRGNRSAIGHQGPVIKFKQELLVLDHVQERIHIGWDIVQFQEKGGFDKRLIQNVAPIGQQIS